MSLYWSNKLECLNAVKQVNTVKQVAIETLKLIMAFAYSTAPIHHLTSGGVHAP